jgi:hypothetical protein
MTEQLTRSEQLKKEIILMQQWGEFFKDLRELQKGYEGEFGGHYNNRSAFCDELWEDILLELQGCEPEGEDEEFPNYCYWHSFAPKYLEMFGEEEYTHLLNAEITKAMNWVQMLEQLKANQVKPVPEYEDDED